jgi:hypothetical protein
MRPSMSFIGASAVFLGLALGNVFSLLFHCFKLLCVLWAADHQVRAVLLCPAGSLGYFVDFVHVHVSTYVHCLDAMDIASLRSFPVCLYGVLWCTITRWLHDEQHPCPLLSCVILDLSHGLSRSRLLLVSTFIVYDLLFCSLSYLGIYRIVSYRHSPAPKRVALSHILDIKYPPSHFPCHGGGRQHEFSFEQIAPYVVSGDAGDANNAFKFVSHDYVRGVGSRVFNCKQNLVYANIPLRDIVKYLPVKVLLRISKIHRININCRAAKIDMLPYFDLHHCASCNDCFTIFSVIRSKRCREKLRVSKTRDGDDNDQPFPPCVSRVPTKRYEGRSADDAESNGGTLPNPSVFPPTPPDNQLLCEIVRGVCVDSSPNMMEEGGCAVCGQLTQTTQLTRLKTIKNHLHILKAQGVSRIQRNDASDPVREFSGPILDYRCNRICDRCRKQVRKGIVPRNALAGGIWLGDVPIELSSLRFVERLLVARVRINSCFIRVAASGLRKMTSHVIAFESPVPKVYQRLPPPVEDLDDVLAVLFTGPCKPTDKEFRRVPLLVRRAYVARALEWLKLNHVNYNDLDIAYDELNRYPENVPPVSIEYQHSQTNKRPEGTSLFDDGDEEGVDDGECPFVVHGLTSDQMITKSVEALKGIALKHWNNKGGALAVSHGADSLSIFNNSGLYPQAFPWLFPYGLGGIGSTTLSEKAHMRHLLMYHDKRFQYDVAFPFVAFSHQQVKAASSAGFLLAESSKFNDIAGRLLSVDQETLASMSSRMADGETVKPTTEDERSCFQLIRDLDHINGKVSGSVTSKKYMRTEIWSLIAYMGAPFWYITLSPADNKHPLCLYFADNVESFNINVCRSEDERYRLIANNPVAGARFFDFMVNMFIKHVLGYGTGRRGVYGDASAFYGTVEQQGRLTLHLHMLLWIRGTLSPDEMRRRILDPTSAFRRQLVEYLESVHAGEFLSAEKEDVEAYTMHASASENYCDPTETLPETPPPPCRRSNCGSCNLCIDLASWWARFRLVVNTLLLKSNVHKCSSNRNKDGTQHKGRAFKGCLDNIWGRCKARFPRALFQLTEIDPATGSINMKKTEAWLNTFTYVVTYLFRCNTDVTSLRSGTAIKSVLLYVSNYVTKLPLKTHVVFDTIRSIFERNPDVVGGCDTRKEKARKLMTKVANSLSAKMEMGSPMICMYLLGNPDHYKSHEFRVFYWQSFVSEARHAWTEKERLADSSRTEVVPTSSPEVVDDEFANNMKKGRLTVIKHNNRVVGISPVHDYIYRSEDLEKLSLYEWMARCERRKLPVKKKSKRAQNNQSANRSNSLSSDEGENIPNSSRCNASTQTLYRFMPEHPLAETHGIRCCPPEKEKVPNFVGPTLPRFDQGDREYYCSTMLTLFKPWRSGLDLRRQDEDWDSAFNAHQFSPRHRDIMKNANLRYECLDAKDDFHAQMVKGGIGIGAWDDLDTDVIQDMEQAAVDECIGVPHDIKYDPDEVSMVTGKRQRARDDLMTAMKQTMQGLGWTESIPDLLPDHLELKPLPPGIIQPGAAWKAAVSQKRAEILDLRSRYMPSIASSVSIKCAASSHFVPDEVRVVDKSYLSCNFVSKDWLKSIEQISCTFGLNMEQNRAFRIVANHACSPDSEQLKMYIGGMAGTGKSQVLKALIEFFSQRKESHRLIVVAPTGSAAALLGGSTYHFTLGINSDGGHTSNIQLAQVKSRLQGVQCFFVDEVSMLSCRDMYLISARLARVLNCLDTPFGGMNMIFAGDFAQLPPVIGQQNSALYSRTVGSDATALRDQEAAIGKALWHQVTTVVILRTNMRQRAQSTEDALFRQALANMRYKACTPADITFLKTRVSSGLPGRPCVKDKRFRNVSIITSLNSLKDEINRLGSLRFAHESGQVLVDFVSVDSIPSEDTEKAGHKRKTAGRRRQTRHGKIPLNIQTILWDQPACANTKLIPGKLSLCVGMPVMIRNNAATEMCITKGQEALVYSWQGVKGLTDLNVLDTLFVKLVNPPAPVEFDGLPLNVVPLMRNSVTTCCSLPDDTTLTISRSQVEVLPNFAMTDYASQGKTRENNVVDLTYIRSHQGYYTALSRSGSAAGTLILGSFHPSKITGGASGALRQEFRELELLDDITTCRFENKLPRKIAMAGDRRNTLIAQFRKHKGLHYMPSGLHNTLKWNKRDPYLECEDHNVVQWRIVEPVTRKGPRVDVSAECKPDKQICANARKRTFSDKLREDAYPNKKQKLHHTAQQGTEIPADPQTIVPIGTQWQQNSCAYDAVCTVLFNIWHENTDATTVSWQELHNDLLDSLTADFSSHTSINSPSGMYSLEQIRDYMRRRFSRISGEFPFGQYASVHTIMDRLLTSSVPILSSKRQCPNGHTVDNEERTVSSCEIMTPNAPDNLSIQQYIDNFSVPLSSSCPECECDLIRHFSFACHPPLLAIELWQGLPEFGPDLHVEVHGLHRRYSLRGVIYFAANHFTARVVTQTGIVWFHDGIFSGSTLIYESANVSSMPRTDSILAIYSREY